MSFTPAIPYSGETLGQSRTQVEGNFTVINSTIALNHVPMNSAGAGKHNFCEFPVQAQSPATSALEVAIYSRSGTGAVPQLFLQQQNQALNAADVLMSRLDVALPENAVNGWTFLPGGLIMQWGIGQFAGAAANVNILFNASNINFPTTCYNVSLTGIGFNNTFDVTNVTPTGFTASRSLGSLGANQQFYWTAIGN